METYLGVMEGTPSRPLKPIREVMKACPLCFPSPFFACLKGHAFPGPAPMANPVQLRKCRAGEWVGFENGNVVVVFARFVKMREGCRADHGIGDVHLHCTLDCFARGHYGVRHHPIICFRRLPGDHPEFQLVLRKVSALPEFG